MKGFVDDYSTVQGAGDGRAIMGYYDAETLYFYDFLAREYLICDRWFSAFPGPTEVNRAFLLAGHSANKIVNTELVLYTSTHRLMTVFDRLSHAQVSWRSYFHDAPDLRTFTQFAFQLGNILKIDEFYEDAARGTLPSVSWIDPNFELTGLIGLPDAANDDHPPADIRRGQKLVSDIYDALSANPEKWKQTLFIVTYDEHGGFFDHVEPPIRKDRAPFRKNTLFDRFGVRVPAFLISPWVARGSVSHVELEHTSIAKTILDRFCPGDDHAVMGERLAGAPALDSLLSSSCRDDIPKIAAPATVTTVALAVGGASFEPAPLGAVPRSDLQLRLHALRMRLLGEGMPPDTV